MAASPLPPPGIIPTLFADCMAHRKLGHAFENGLVLSGLSVILLAQAAEIRDWVGLRPGRPSVRLEEELIPCTGANRGVLRVVHNYGHGGAGLTLAWGCAGHAVELVSKLLKEQYTRSKM